ncbi:MAG: hypothetical protein A2X78_00765 [Gammaproteobacteria bacterium GWE2_37_16]|nr:MAG: hypothetical protein A2X78_00765 [Gammaproteobacteria bacterium GWE2_37_16]
MKFSGKFSLNKDTRILQNKVLLGLGAGIIALIFMGSMFMSSGKPEEAKPKQQVDLTGASVGDAKSEFNGSESNAALQAEAKEVDVLKKQLSSMQKQMELMQKNTQPSADQRVIQDLQTKIENLSKDLKNQPARNPSSLTDGVIPQSQASIGMTSFSYSDEATTEIKNKTNYVPPGTFAKAVLLSGADTNAGTSGQTDTLPVTMRVLDDGVLPNGEHSSLKGCFVTAAAYGDASSERGQVRLQRLSCVRTGGRILDIAVEGTISDMGGNDGIRGHVVMRNGKLLWNAGVSGLLSGIGSAMQQSLTTQSTSPLGTTSTVPSGKVLQYGVYNGANTAMEKLADYYIKLAELYHPIVQIHAGSNVDVVFLKGFSLDFDHNQLGLSVTPKLGAETSQPAASQENVNQQAQPIMGAPDLKNLQMGQTL